MMWINQPTGDMQPDSREQPSLPERHWASLSDSFHIHTWVFVPVTAHPGNQPLRHVTETQRREEWPVAAVLQVGAPAGGRTERAERSGPRFPPDAAPHGACGAQIPGAHPESPIPGPTPSLRFRGPPRVSDSLGLGRGPGTGIPDRCCGGRCRGPPRRPPASLLL